MLDDLLSTQTHSQVSAFERHDVSFKKPDWAFVHKMFLQRLDLYFEQLPPTRLADDTYCSSGSCIWKGISKTMTRGYRPGVSVARQLCAMCLCAAATSGMENLVPAVHCHHFSVY